MFELEPRLRIGIIGAWVVNKRLNLIWLVIMFDHGVARILLDIG